MKKNFSLGERVYVKQGKKLKEAYIVGMRAPIMQIFAFLGLPSTRILYKTFMELLLKFIKNPEIKVDKMINIKPLCLLLSKKFFDVNLQDIAAFFTIKYKVLIREGDRTREDFVSFTRVFKTRRDFEKTIKTNVYCLTCLTEFPTKEEIPKGQPKLCSKCIEMRDKILDKITKFFTPNRTDGRIEGYTKLIEAIYDDDPENEKIQKKIEELKDNPNWGYEKLSDSEIKFTRRILTNLKRSHPLKFPKSVQQPLRKVFHREIKNYKNFLETGFYDKPTLAPNNAIDYNYGRNPETLFASDSITINYDGGSLQTKLGDSLIDEKLVINCGTNREFSIIPIVDMSNLAAYSLSVGSFTVCEKYIPKDHTESFKVEDKYINSSLYLNFWESIILKKEPEDNLSLGRATYKTLKKIKFIDDPIYTKTSLPTYITFSNVNYFDDFIDNKIFYKEVPLNFSVIKPVSTPHDIEFILQINGVEHSLPIDNPIGISDTDILDIFNISKDEITTCVITCKSTLNNVTEEIFKRKANFIVTDKEHPLPKMKCTSKEEIHEFHTPEEYKIEYIVSTETKTFTKVYKIAYKLTRDDDPGNIYYFFDELDQDILFNTNIDLKTTLDVKKHNIPSGKYTLEMIAILKFPEQIPYNVNNDEIERIIENENFSRDIKPEDHVNTVLIQIEKLNISYKQQKQIIESEDPLQSEASGISHLFFYYPKPKLEEMMNIIESKTGTSYSNTTVNTFNKALEKAIQDSSKFIHKTKVIETPSDDKILVKYFNSNFNSEITDSNNVWFHATFQKPKDMQGSDVDTLWEDETLLGYIKDSLSIENSFVNHLTVNKGTHERIIKDENEDEDKIHILAEFNLGAYNLVNLDFKINDAVYFLVKSESKSLLKIIYKGNLVYIGFPSFNGIGWESVESTLLENKDKLSATVATNLIPALTENLPPENPFDPLIPFNVDGKHLYRTWKEAKENALWIFCPICREVKQPNLKDKRLSDFLGIAEYVATGNVDQDNRFANLGELNAYKQRIETENLFNSRLFDTYRNPYNKVLGIPRSGYTVSDDYDKTLTEHDKLIEQEYEFYGNLKKNLFTSDYELEKSGKTRATVSKVSDTEATNELLKIATEEDAALERQSILNISNTLTPETRTKIMESLQVGNIQKLPPIRIGGIDKYEKYNKKIQHKQAVNAANLEKMKSKLRIGLVDLNEIFGFIASTITICADCQKILDDKLKELTNILRGLKGCKSRRVKTGSTIPYFKVKLDTEGNYVNHTFTYPAPSKGGKYDKDTAIDSSEYKQVLKLVNKILKHFDSLK